MQKLILGLGLAVAAALAGPFSTVKAQPRAHFGVAEEFPSHERLDARMDALAPVLDAWLAHGMRTGDAPGISVGLILGNDWQWTGLYGLADIEAGAPVTEETRFRIASISKPFTAHAIMILRDEGKLTLDDPITDHLPWFSLQGYDPDNAPIRIYHLLTHYSGMPRDSALTDFSAHYQPPAEDIRETLPQQSLQFTPGTRQAYANMGYTLLGLIIEAASGQSYHDFIRTRIFDPLGMERSLPEPARDEADVATGYYPADTAGRRRAAPYEDLNAFVPAGGIASTAEDMLKFARLNLGIEPEGQILSPGTLIEMQTIRAPYGLHAFVGTGYSWAIDKRVEWDVNGNDTEWRVYHGGELPTQTAHLEMLPESDFATIVLTNAADGRPQEVTEVLRSLVRRFLAPRCETGPGAGPATGLYDFQGEEYWLFSAGCEVILTSPRAEDPFREALSLSYDAEQDIYRMGGQSVEIVRGEQGDVVRLIFPSFELPRIGPLPAANER